MCATNIIVNSGLEKSYNNVINKTLYKIKSNEIFGNVNKREMNCKINEISNTKQDTMVIRTNYYVKYYKTKHDAKMK